MIVATAGLKGGTGKTMVSVNMAAIISEGARVLFIDCDPQANSTSGFGVDTSVVGRPSLADVLRKNSVITPTDVIIQHPLEGLPNLDLIPSALSLTLVGEEMITYPGREHVLSRWVDSHYGELSAYDYIFMDTAPSLGQINQNAFLVADSIILITNVSRNGLEGVRMLTAYWEEIRQVFEKPDNIKALVLNNYDRRLKISRELYEFLSDDDEFSDLFVEPAIYSRKDMIDTEIDQTPINLLYPGSESHNLFVELIDNLKMKGAL